MTVVADVAEEVGSGFRRLRVAAVDPLTRDSVAITFEVPPELREAFRFRPGQHLTLRREIAGQELRRTYSVCASAAGGPLRVAVKLMEGGAFSTWVLQGLRAGDEVEVLPPAGSFGPAPDAARTRRYGLIAAGSGVTPVLSIAWTVLDVEPSSEVVLVYGNRTTGDVMFLEELADLKDRYPARLTVLHVLSREEQGSELLSGRIDRDRLQRLLATLVPAESVDEWYLCGPFGMVTEGRQTLLDAGVDRSSVHVELFHADPPPPRERTHVAGTSALTTVVVDLHGRTTTVQVDPDGGSVLDAVLAVRADAPYACKGGVCGTCRALCTFGAVEMDVNYALEPDELARGVVLTCQSHPTTPEVRLEYL
ncbi:MAG: phenylacetate-CoA oxygenase/reductase, PaaK subunit [Frankiales bacterium]|jgi:ring-1,2-phenylacetyl-CoA epoxidase subunit PaaE|nr:phenylacetate-CoA oxygenase/reductase, PaaK subunit [Frankiales bacterium]